MLDEVQQLDAVGHPQQQRLQTWGQLVHAEQLQGVRLLLLLLLLTAAPGAGRDTQVRAGTHQQGGAEVHQQSCSALGKIFCVAPKKCFGKFEALIIYFISIFFFPPANKCC